MRYLEKPDFTPGNPEGRLRVEGSCFVLEGEPYVLDMARRVLRGSRSLGPDQVSVPMMPLFMPDLNWLLMRYAIFVDDDVAYLELLELAKKHVPQVVQIPDRVDPGLRIPLRPYQQEGISFLLKYRKTLLADQVGLGKTGQALGFVAAAQAFPCLTIVPAHLLQQWPVEIEKFLGPTATWQILRGARPYQLQRTHVTLIHYGVVQKWFEVLRDLGFGTLILDEVQELRHPDTYKHRAISMLAKNAANVIGLSGTPICNRGGEIWSVMSAISDGCLGPEDRFLGSFCTAKSDVVADPRALSAELKSKGFLLRRTKEAVLNELPAKHEIVHEVGADQSVYERLLLPAIDGALKAQEGMQTKSASLNHENVAITIARGAAGMAKAPFVADFTAAILEAGEPVLVFGHHHVVFDDLRERLARWEPGEISGRTKNKAAVVDHFMHGHTNLIFISMRASAGLNLQRARVVVFAELDWSPQIHVQCIGRAHRMGQGSNVLVYYLVSSETSDLEVMAHLGLKNSQFVGLMGDREEDVDEYVLGTEDPDRQKRNLLNRLRGMKQLVKVVRKERPSSHAA